jgi:hypothetical protein
MWPAADRGIVGESFLQEEKAVADLYALIDRCGNKLEGTRSLVMASLEQISSIWISRTSSSFCW